MDPTSAQTHLIADAAERARAYVTGAGSRPVFPTADALAGLDALRTPFPDEPRAAADVLAELDAHGSPATVVSTQGRYFGFVTGGLDPAAHAAAILAGAWDQNTGGAIMSPVAATLNEVACGWVIDALGLPASAAGSFTSGATIANLTGIIAGRDALYARQGWDVGANGLAGAPALRVVVGEEVHASVLKALRLAGFGEAQIERVPTDHTGAIKANEFPTDTDSTTLVLLQAGNVNTGASDPFADIIPGVRERGGWVHIDGAFGLWAAASPTLRHLVEGAELADSWATDAHKWLNAPYDSGFCAVRDPEDLARAMTADAAYLRGSEGSPMHRGIQMSQRARAVETWAMLASHGRRGLADLIDRTCAHARDFAQQLEAGGATILAPVMLNQVLVEFGDDQQTEKTLAAIQADGTTWAGGTVWNGKRAMRVSVSDWATTADDVKTAANAMLQAWQAHRA